ncbi:hypothetical protein J1C56_29450 [Aminobacter anthyllidis]|uniref:Uncharacterized protein n=1 Tax=Aminobacter anthyllidis TaxID=1035067 RepID=A0A9X1AHI8_9HYPH|nr:TorF family putative porin [Aminobacter anthyllidis]MBT1159681.1 hypothetical protein [Aminobacter anthyllidis]
MKFKHFSLIFCIACLNCEVAVAADAAAESVPSSDAAFDVAVGAAFVTNYIASGGVSQTNDRPAIQGYLEVSYGTVYAGVWASNVNFPDFYGKDVEVDVYGGLRHSFGKLSVDLGYAQYLYGKDDANYGEVYAKLNYDVTDKLSVGGNFFREVFNDSNWVDLKARYSGLPWDLSLSGKFGSDLGSKDFIYPKTKIGWDIGVSKQLTETVKLDVRYYDSNLDPGRVVAALSFDTMLSALLAQGN